MQVKVVLAVVVSLFGWSASGAEEDCRSGLDRALGRYTNVVESLRLDKPGQAHVYAPNGLEFTPAETFWLKGQLREADASCTLHHSSDALRHLELVRRLIDSREQH